MQDELTRAIARFDWPRCKRELEQRVDDSIEERCEFLEERIRESGRLLVQRHDEERERRRSTFLEGARQYLAGASDETRAAFEGHVAGILVVESGFHAVLEAVRAGPNAHLAPDVHVWALIERLAEEDALMHADIQSQMRREPFIFDPYSVHVVSPSGHAYRPDAVNAAVIDVFSSTLLMLGHQNGWFDADGALVLPPRVMLPEKATFRAGLTIALGQGWRLLDYAAERWRFFGGLVEKKPFPYVTDEGETRSVDAIVFEHAETDAALTFDLLDTVAHERLSRLFMQVHSEVSSAPQTRVRADATELAPKQYISVGEAYAVLALCHAFHFDVAGDETAYAGLKLREWARGYAALVREAEGVAPPAGGSFTLSWSVEELRERLRAAGLSGPAAGTFIERATFGQTVGDLFDAPLLRTSDGRLHCLPHILRITNIPRIVLSILASLEVQVERRGPALEADLKKLLHAAGFTCERLHFRHDGEEFECDAAIVWDRRLFLFECKNRSLSAGKPSKRHRFVHDVLHALEQLQRLKGVLEVHPEPAREKLGDEWDSIVGCVVNGLPFSLPKDDESYVSDMSALGRFFQGPTINLVSPVIHGTGRTTWIARPIRQLWSGAKPTADDFVKQLKEPVQVMSAIDQYRAIESQWALSPDLAVVLTMIRMVPQSMEVRLEALGAKDDPAHVLDELRARVTKLREEDTPPAAALPPRPDPAEPAPSDGAPGTRVPT